MVLNAKIKLIKENCIYKVVSNIKEIKNLFTDLPVIPPNLIIKYIWEDAQSYLTFHTQLYRLKPYSLGDLIIGKINATYILK